MQINLFQLGEAIYCLKFPAFPITANITVYINYKLSCPCARQEGIHGEQSYFSTHS